MKLTLKPLFAFTLCIAAIPSTGAQEPTDYVELEVGRTRILCYTEPCPWNGIADADSPTWPVTMLWAGAEPPPMRGSVEDQKFILENYAENCTLVSGLYKDGILEIASIIGPC